MEVNKKISSSNSPDFFSKEMIITRKSLNENQLKLTYQNQSFNMKVTMKLKNILINKSNKF